MSLLAAMDRHPLAPVFRRSLAEPGQKGTLENRLKRFHGRVFAKTGTLRQANGLAGYATAADGDRLAFAILVNNHTAAEPRRRGRDRRHRGRHARGPLTMDISIGPDLRGRVSLGVVVLEGVTVREADAALLAEVEACCAELRAKYGEGRSADVPGVADARTLYKAVGLDPTKHRPSNEALLRRALKGEPLYRINTLVDALNLASLRAQLPFGLYDLDRVEPPVVLRKGAAGESYEGIRKGTVSASGSAGPGGREGALRQPHLRLRANHDHARREARRWWWPTPPPAYGRTRLEQVLQQAADILTRHCGGREAERYLM